MLFALGFLLFGRLGGCLTVDRRDERAVFQEVGRRRQRSGVRVHLDPPQIGRAGAVGVERRNGELKNDVVFDPLRDDLGDRTRQIHDGRERRTLLAAGDVITNTQNQESEESWSRESERV